MLDAAAANDELFKKATLEEKRTFLNHLPWGSGEPWVKPVPLAVHEVQYRWLAASYNPFFQSMICDSPHPNPFSEFAAYCGSLIRGTAVRVMLHTYLLPFRLKAAATIRMTERANTSGDSYHTCLGFYVGNSEQLLEVKAILVLMGQARTILCEEDLDDGALGHPCVRECPPPIRAKISAFKRKSSEGMPKPDVEIFLHGVPNWHSVPAEARDPGAWLVLWDVFGTLKFHGGGGQFQGNYPLGPADTVFRALIVHEGTIPQN